MMNERHNVRFAASALAHHYDRLPCRGCRYGIKSASNVPCWIGDVEEVTVAAFAESSQYFGGWTTRWQLPACVEFEIPAEVVALALLVSPLSGLARRCLLLGNVFLRRLTHNPGQRHLFLLSEVFERFIEIGRKTDRRTDQNCPLIFHALSLSLFPVHVGVPPLVFTTLHHDGETKGVRSFGLHLGSFPSNRSYAGAEVPSAPIALRICVAVFWMYSRLAVKSFASPS